MFARALGNQLMQLLFPQRHCLLCNNLTGYPGLCPACQEERKALHQCAICATFIEQPGICKYCAKRRPNFVQARAIWPYGGIMRERLRALKYQEQTWLRRPLALLMTQVYQEHYAQIEFDAVLPTPLSRQRYKQRGYNQSQLLSEFVAEEVNIEHAPQLLHRVTDTPPLATYSGLQRQALLKQAFAATQKVDGLTLLLVDDIYTSGATLRTCAAVLYAAGAKKVYCLTAAGFDARKKQEFSYKRANNMTNEELRKG